MKAVQNKCNFSRLCNQPAFRQGLCQHHYNWTHDLADDYAESLAAPPMGQAQLHSILEAVSGTAIGFVISWAILTLIISPLFHLRTHAGEDFIITCIFTVASILRSYWVRRLFNYLHIRRVK